MKLLNFKHMVRDFTLHLGFVLQLVLIANPTITKAEISSVTLLSLCSELQINMGILPPDLHIHAVYHPPPILDHIEGYLDNLGRVTRLVSINEDIDQGKNLYKKYRGLPGLAADKARASSSEQFKLLRETNDEKVIELYCNVTSKQKKCSISDVSEINFNCAKALVEVHFEQCIKTTELTSDLTIPCAPKGIFSEGASHHRNGRILRSAYRAWRSEKRNWNEKLERPRRKRNDLKP
jgi:hypothetical protein